jgi:uncharacterized membrane protein YhaH (DUF805 family)
MNQIDWKYLLLSFDGRINRAKYWIVAGLSVVASLVAAGLLFVPLLGWILFAVIILGLIYAGVAVGVKRLHDRNKSGWWLLLFYFVPGALQGLAGDSYSGFSLLLSVAGFAVSIWALIELGFLRGTVGPNDYGPDPLEGQA